MKYYVYAIPSDDGMLRVDDVEDPRRWARQAGMAEDENISYVQFEYDGDDMDQLCEIAKTTGMPLLKELEDRYPLGYWMDFYIRNT